MNTLKKLRNENSNVGLLFATLFLVPFQTVFFIPLSLDALLKLAGASTIQGPESIFSFSPTILIFYVIVPIVYCIIVSHLFQPKRLVSPLFIQIGAYFLFSGIVEFYTYSSFPLDLFHTMILLTFFSVFGAIACVIGTFQLFIVRKVIGLNLEENLERVTYSVNADFKTMATKILNSDFLFAWKFNRTHDLRHILLYKMHRDSGESVALALGPDRNDDKKSVLSSVAYQQTFNSINGWEMASVLRREVIKSIRENLREANPLYDLTEKDDADATISSRAYLHATEPSRSKIIMTRDFFREVWKISHYYIYAISLTLIVFVGLSIAFLCRFGNIDTNTYISILAVIFIAFVSELGISLREELKRKKIEDIDDLT